MERPEDGGYEMMGARVEILDPAESRLNRTLVGVCRLLILYIASHIVLQLASLPGYYQRVTTGTVPTLVVGGADQMSNALIAQWAAQRGMPLRAYALYSMALNTMILIGFATIAALILWRARRQWFHWFTALVLLFIPSGGLWEFTMVSQLAYRYVALGGLLWPSFLLFLYLFPNGRAAPRWTRWPMGALIVLHLAIQSVPLAAQYSPAFDGLFALAGRLFPVVLLAFPLILVSQVYRYMRVSTPVEKAQSKWFVAGLALWLILGQLIDLAANTNSGDAATRTGLAGDLGELLMLIIPAAIGIGILRYRLFDIDVIIRKTLVYSALTLLLAGVYFGGVTLLQAVFSAVSNQQSAISIVLSTLAIAALFNPLRRRVQEFVDRRFFRRKYNAEQALASFAALAREEVDLEEISEQLLTTVEETVQPESVSLWLRPTGEGAKRR